MDHGGDTAPGDRNVALLDLQGLALERHADAEHRGGGSGLSVILCGNDSNLSIIQC